MFCAGGWRGGSISDCRVRLARSKTNRGVSCYRSCIKGLLSAVHVRARACVSGKICFKPQRVFLRLSQTAGGSPEPGRRLNCFHSGFLKEAKHMTKTEAGDGCGRFLSEVRLSDEAPFLTACHRTQRPFFFFYSFDISEKELTESLASNSAAAKGSLSSGAPFSWQQKKKHTHQRGNRCLQTYERQNPTKPNLGFVICGGEEGL